MATPSDVGIVGLNALRRDLTRLAADAGPVNRAFAAAGMEATAPIAEATRQALPDDSGRGTGNLASSVRVTRTRSGAGVRMGSARYPYAGWIEFGGVRHSPHDSARPYREGGRYLFPAAKNLAQKALETYTLALNRALGSFDWTNETTNPEVVHD